jgi:heterodisulfide reductase subunit A-like polyferredoxin
MALSRRDFFGLFGGRPPAAAPSPAVVVTEAVQARAAAFREALATRGRSDSGPTYAVVTERLCLLRLGTECSTCAEACPEPGALAVRGRSVEIDAARCTGCGRCAERCPAPIPALAMRRVTP